MTRSGSALFDALQRLGFKRWYERQLLAGHAHLVLALLSLLALLGSFEAMGLAQGGRAWNWAGVLASASVGFWALRRYGVLLGQAESVSLQATCPHCGTYGRLKCLCARPDGAEVSCRACSGAWVIQD
ncbi:MAG: hypothetical protein U1E77_07985 [Inhella sp.]